MILTLSVVVCTRDRSRELERFLAAVRALSPAPDEVIVVDNSPTATSTRRLAAALEARVLQEPRPGLSRARNAGIAGSGGDIVAFIDDDAVPDPGWGGALRDAFSDPSVSAVAGRVVGLTSPAHSSADLGSAPRRFDRSGAHWFEQANFGGIGIGCNMAIRRDVLAEGRRFCEWLGAGTKIPGSEEHYMFFELLRDGHTVAYVPDAVVRHDDGRDPVDRRVRERRMREAFFGYSIGLLVQEPGFRRETLRYLAGGVTGDRREWRPLVAPETPTIPRGALLGAACKAPWRYALSRWRHRR